MMEKMIQKKNNVTKKNKKKQKNKKKTRKKQKYRKINSFYFYLKNILLLYYIYNGSI